MTVFYDGSMLLHYYFNPPASGKEPDTRYCEVTSVIDSDFRESGKVYHFLPREFDSIEDALGESIDRIEIMEVTHRGGGGFSTPSDAVLYLESGRQVATTRAIARSLIDPATRDERTVADSWTGAGYTFGIYKEK